MVVGNGELDSRRRREVREEAFPIPFQRNLPTAAAAQLFLCFCYLPDYL